MRQKVPAVWRRWVGDWPPGERHGDMERSRTRLAPVVDELRSVRQTRSTSASAGSPTSRPFGCSENISSEMRPRSVVSED